MLGGVSAIWLFSRLPQPQPGGAPPAATVVNAINRTLPTAIATPSVLTLTPTLESAQEQAANCMGGATSLEDARKHAGFKVLSPKYLPETLQASLIGMNRLFPKGFQVYFYYRNLMNNAAWPFLGIYQRAAPVSAEPLRLDQKISFLMIRGTQGQLIEPLDTPNTPIPPGTLLPNPTLTAFAEGRVTAVMQTAVPLLPCPWISTQITTPVPWTPAPGRTSSATATSFVAMPSTTLRWVEDGVQIIIDGTYSREELLKVAESLQ